MASVKNKLRELLWEKTDDSLIQFVRYFVVGGFAFVVDFSTLYALTDFAGMHYLLSAALAFLLGLSTNYALSVTWVFNRRVLSNRAAEFLIFGIIGIVGLGINELVMYVLTGLLGIHYLASKVVSTIIVFLWNFLARKLTLFR